MKKGTKAKRTVDIRAELGKLKRKSARLEAIARLGEAGAVEAVMPLLELGKRVKRGERSAICKALVQIGELAIGPLVEEGLESKDPGVRRCAVRALAGMGKVARPAVKPLLKRLGDKSAGVRLETIDALGKIGDPRAVEPLIACLDDADRDVRERAADALGELGEVALEATCQAFEEGESLRARAAAALALGEIGGSISESALRKVFADRSTPSRLRVAALTALEEALDEDVVPVAAAALEEDVGVRREAVRCLCDEDTPESTTVLMSLYADEDKKVRAWALSELRSRYRQLLERIKEGESSALPALLAAWGTMSKKQTREAEEIAQELSGIGRPLVPLLVSALEGRGMEAPVAARVIEVLERMETEAAEAYGTLVAQLDSADVATCCAAARALGALGDERAIPVLAALLSFDADLLKAKKGKEKRARKRALALQACAAEGLGRLGKAALAIALKAARGHDATARRGGVMVLGYIGGGRALATLDRAVAESDPMVREAAAEAMERAAASDVRRLDRMLQSEDERVRVKAVEALGKLDDLRSLDLLLRAYGDPSVRVNEAVVRVLAQREGERAHSILIAAAAGGNVSAIHALAEHPVRQAIPALMEALDSPWGEVYGAALEAIRAYVDLFGPEGADDPEAMTALRRVIPELTYLLHDDSAKVRRLALEGLAAFRDAGTVQEIAYLLLDEKESIRLSAVRILASIGGEDATAALVTRYEETDDEDLREEIADALEQMGDDGSTMGSPEPV